LFAGLIVLCLAGEADFFVAPAKFALSPRSSDREEAILMHTYSAIHFAHATRAERDCISYQSALSLLGWLLQSVDYIKVREQAAIAIDVGFCVGRH
jgi:hypothetical protein